MHLAKLIPLAAATAINAGRAGVEPIEEATKAHDKVPNCEAIEGDRTFLEAPEKILKLRGGPETIE